MKGLNVISTHISAAIASAIALVALFHPGFGEQSWVQAAVPVVALVAAGVLELVHLITHRKLTVTLKQIEAYANVAKLESELQKVVAPVKAVVGKAVVDKAANAANTPAAKK